MYMKAEEVCSSSLDAWSGPGVQFVRIDVFLWTGLWTAISLQFRTFSFMLSTMEARRSVQK